MTSTRLALPALLLAASMLGLPACSDSDNPPPPASTTVAGTVTATGGGALDQFVTITMTPTGGGTATTFNTTASGTFDQMVAAGTYDVTATRPGYEDFSMPAIDIVANMVNAGDFSMNPLPANTYLGSADCGICHGTTYTTFMQTGHPFKLNKVNGAAPSYPFTNIDGVEMRIDDDDLDIPMGLVDPQVPGTDNSLGTPSGWGEISYVIGGFHWKARFMDADGYIVTGTEVQYNFATDAMSAYHNNEQDKPFNCGNCHTTGWQHFDATVNNNRQDGLPGFDGTFAEQGIGCESCHGAGSTHAQTTMMADITKNATPRTTADFMDGTFAYGKPVSCGECHTRDGEKDYDTYESAFDVARDGASLARLPEGGRINSSGGLIRHHEQFDEILGINPDTVDTVRSPGFMSTHGDCMTCHDPHKATVNRGNAAVTDPGVDSSNASCLACHSAATYDPANNNRGSMMGLNCVDCHMPKLGKSAVSTTLANGVLQGDVTSHIFSIDLSGAPQFDASNHSYPYITGDWACRNCHGSGLSGGAFPLPGGMIPAGFDFHP